MVAALNRPLTPNSAHVGSNRVTSIRPASRQGAQRFGERSQGVPRRCQLVAQQQRSNDMQGRSGRVVVGKREPLLEVGHRRRRVAQAQARERSAAVVGLNGISTNDLVKVRLRSRVVAGHQPAGPTLLIGRDGIRSQPNGGRVSRDGQRPLMPRLEDASLQIHGIGPLRLQVARRLRIAVGFLDMLGAAFLFAGSRLDETSPLVKRRLSPFQQIASLRTRFHGYAGRHGTDLDDGQRRLGGNDRLFAPATLSVVGGPQGDRNVLLLPLARFHLQRFVQSAHDERDARRSANQDDGVHIEPRGGGIFPDRASQVDGSLNVSADQLLEARSAHLQLQPVPGIGLPPTEGIRALTGGQTFLALAALAEKMQIDSLGADGQVQFLLHQSIEIVVDRPVEVLAADAVAARLHRQAEGVVAVVADQQGQVERPAAQVVHQDVTAYLYAGLGIGDSGGDRLLRAARLPESRLWVAASRSLSFSISSNAAGQVMTVRGTASWNCPSSASRLSFLRISAAAATGVTRRSPIIQTRGRANLRFTALSTRLRDSRLARLSSACRPTMTSVGP